MEAFYRRISVNAKEKLIWSGSYEVLQMFMEEVL